MRIATAFALVFLALCPAAMAQGEKYPQVVSGFGQFDRFPESAAGYKRINVVAFAPGMSDYRIEYVRRDESLLDVVGLYYYPRQGTFERQLQEEAGGVTQAHRDAKILSRGPVKLQSGGRSYSGYLITFEYADNLAGQRQQVASQLLLVHLPGKSFKVRSTAPASQAKAAAESMRRLLDAVRWDE